jgi:predicted RNA binding protein YcfA (HicA-like mRNA interferase family)
VTARSKLLAKILSGSSSQNVSFDELVSLLQHLGFALRINGSHHIFSRDGVVEILNLQPRNDRTAKPYQVRQVRNVIIRYKLAGEDYGN